MHCSANYKNHFNLISRAQSPSTETVSFFKFHGEHYIKAITHLPAITAPPSLTATPHFINPSHRQAKLIQVNFIVFWCCLTFVCNYFYHFIAMAESNQDNYLKMEVSKF